MEIHVIRHTKVAVDKTICYGQTDVALANTYAEELANYKNKLPQDFDIVFSSPLSRCKQLAQDLQVAPIKFESTLQEMYFGKWENTAWSDINQDALNIWMMDFVNVKTPNGESLLDLFKRVENFMNNLRQAEHKKVLIVAHAGVIRCIWAYLLNIPLNNIFKLPVGFGELFICKLNKNTAFDSIKQLC
jgi:alpha-ribazole phosphatase